MSAISDKPTRSGAASIRLASGIVFLMFLTALSMASKALRPFYKKAAKEVMNKTEELNRIRVNPLPTIEDDQGDGPGSRPRRHTH